MKLGTQIRLPDGREGTVVYNSLIGVGIKWGLHDPDPEEFEGTTGNTIEEDIPDGWQWEPEALLRDPFEGCERHGFTRDQCVGREYKILRTGMVNQQGG